MGVPRRVEKALAMTFFIGAFFGVVLSMLPPGTWWLAASVVGLSVVRVVCVRLGMWHGMNVQFVRRHCKTCDGRGWKPFVRHDGCEPCEGTGLEGAAKRGWRNT